MAGSSLTRAEPRSIGGRNDSGTVQGDLCRRGGSAGRLIRMRLGLEENVSWCTCFRLYDGVVDVDK
jgi:hypothetical protein